MNSPLQIDGASGEGGGQILRTSLSLSAITNQALEIRNIRAKRPNPGLQTQHLMCVQALAKVCQARVEGDRIGSTRLLFEPGEVQSGHFEFDIQTAGSCALLLQCLLPPLLLATDSPSALTLRGGTDVPFAPPSLFMERIFTKALEKMGCHVSIKTPKHGFYPSGGGLMYAKVQPSKIKAQRLEIRGKLKKVNALALSANLPDHVTQREMAVLQKRIANAEINVQAVSSPSPGNLVFLEAEYEKVTNGFSGLGEIDKRAELVAQDAVDAFYLFEKTNACVEEHLADQLLLYAALAEGTSRFSVQRLTPHAVTNLEVLKTWLGTKAEIQGNVLTVEGKKP